jgi:hypothetical protein
MFSMRKLNEIWRGLSRFLADPAAPLTKGWAAAAHPKQTSQLAEEPTDAWQFCQESACLCQAGNLR